MKKKWMLWMLSILLLCSACGGGRSTGSASVNVQLAPSAEAPMEKADGVLNDSFHYSESFVDNSLYQDPNAKVIRRAYLTIQTTEFEASVAALAALTEAQGGYFETARIESGSIQSTNANRSAYYVVRVPKENFVSFRDSIGEVGHLYSIEESSQDVGERYYDTEARLATLTTKRERLLGLLEQAEKMEDIISLENALADVQYEIDSHTTTLRKYDSLIDFSTFEIHLNERVLITQEPGAADSFTSRLSGAFLAGMRDFGDGVEDLILFAARNLIPLLVLAAVVATAIIVLRKKRRKNREE